MASPGHSYLFIYFLSAIRAFLCSHVVYKKCVRTPRVYKYNEYLFNFILMDNHIMISVYFLYFFKFIHE